VAIAAHEAFSGHRSPIDGPSLEMSIQLHLGRYPVFVSHH